MKISSSLLLAVIFSVALVSCGKKPADDSNAENNTVPVRLAEVIHQDVSLPVISSGIITSKKEAHLSFKTGGIISHMYVEEGQNVKAGQLLATLDHTEINSQVSQAQQNVDKLQRDYDRINSLQKENAATLEQLQNVSTGLQVAKDALTSAKFNQQYSSIVANENGTVIKKLMNEGELASPGSPVFILNSTQDNDWVIHIGVADHDWARIKMGDASKVKLDAYPDVIFNAIVSEIADAADPYSGTFQIELKVNPGEKRFANGLIAKIEITPSQQQPLSIIPIEALAECNGKNGFVYTLNADGKSVKKIPVTVSFFRKNQVVLSSIDSATKEVITSGSAYLTENSVVAVADK